MDSQAEDDSLKQFLAQMQDAGQPSTQDPEEMAPPNAAQAQAAAMNPVQPQPVRLRADAPAPAADWAAIAKSLGPKAPEAPKQEPLDWKGIADKLKSAQGLAGMQRTVENSFENSAQPGRYHALPDAGKELIAQAEAPVELAKARTSQEHAQAQADQERQKTAAGVAERDPNSDVSKRAVGAFKAFMGDAQLPPNIDSWSAADVKSFTSGEFLPLMKLKGAKDIAAEKAKAGENSVAAQKLTLESEMNPEHDPEMSKRIAALSDQAGINTFSTIGRQNKTEADAVKRQQQGFEHADLSAERAAQRETDRQLFMAQWHLDHPQDKPVGEETTKRLEALNTIPLVLKDYREFLAGKSDSVSKLGGWMSGILGPDVAKAFGLPGASAQARKELVASALVRAIDGTAVRPGTIESVKKLLPSMTDNPDIQAEGFSGLDKYVAAEAAGLRKTLHQTSSRPLVGEAPPLDTSIPVREPGQEPVLTFKNKKNGQTLKATQAQHDSAKTRDDWELVK